jgi:2-iminobutanoate/2-iminopropanoate deaminase
MKQELRTQTGAAPGGSYSQGMRVGDLIFVAGQGPFDPETGEIVGTSIETQTEQTLCNIEAVLAEAGADLGDLVKVTAFLADLSLFGAYDSAYASRIPEPRPVRTTVGAALGGELIEIDAIAARGSGATG